MGSRTSRFIWSTVAIFAGGCAAQQRTLTAESFMPKPPPVADVARSTPPPSAETDQPKKASELASADPVVITHPKPLDLAPAAEASLASDATTTQPAESPTTAPAAELPGGLYMTLGGVI